MTTYSVPDPTATLVPVGPRGFLACHPLVDCADIVKAGSYSTEVAEPEPGGGRDRDQSMWSLMMRRFRAWRVMPRI